MYIVYRYQLRLNPTKSGPHGAAINLESRGANLADRVKCGEGIA